MVGEKNSRLRKWCSMNIDNVKALVDILNRGGLSRLEVCEGDTKISIEKNTITKDFHEKGDKPAEPMHQQPFVSVNGEALDFNKITEVKAPMVGVFYVSPSPESEPFVTIGSKVKKGDTLCIIEAMKLMNEITAECDGEVVDICLKNGDIAEFGQVLFKIF